MGKTTNGVVQLIEKARLLEEAHVTALGAMNAAEESSDRAAFRKAERKASGACDRACAAERAALQGRVSTREEAAALAVFLFDLGEAGVFYDTTFEAALHLSRRI